LIVTKPPPEAEPVRWHDTDTSLQILQGSDPGYVRIHPKVIDDIGKKISSNVSIFVDGTLVQKINSNEYSEDIWIASGTHTVKAVFPELRSNLDKQNIYRESEASQKFTVDSSGVVIKDPLDPQPPDPPTFCDPGFVLQNGNCVRVSSGGDEIDPSILLVLIVIGIIVAVVGITISKRKKGKSSAKRQKIAPVISTSKVTSKAKATFCKKCGVSIPHGSKFCKKCGTSTIIGSTQTNVTQFWVCPVCGTDLQQSSGKQYCKHCERYF